MLIYKIKIGFLLKFLVFALVFLEVGTQTFALKFVFESYISLENQREEITGALPGEQLGSVIAVGDFDRDGVQDIVTGAPFASENDNQWNGAVKIIFGSRDRSAKKRELDIFGENSGDQFGTSIAVGDFNNDNYDDIAIGAYNATSADKQRTGKVYLVFGSPEMDNQSPNHLSIRQANFAYGTGADQLVGQENGDQFGLSLFALDVNDDGIKDLLVGAPMASGPLFAKSGAVYMYLGSRWGFTVSSNYVFYAQSTNEKFGSSIGGGHVTSDRRNDLVVSAYMADNGDKKQAGRVYVIRYNAFATYAKDSVIMLTGLVEKGWFGFSLDTGNVNGDTYDDLAIATFPYKGARKDARVSIFYGSQNSVKGSADVVIDGSVGEAFLGASVQLKDLNADGKADILLGAPGIGAGKSEEEGSVYEIISGDEPYKGHYSLKKHDYGTLIHGAKFDDWFGSTLAVTDFNDDGKKDLIIGSRYADGENGVDNGKVFVLYSGDKSSGKLRSIMESTDKQVTRAELISQVMDSLNIKKNKSDMIKNCYDYKEFCFFNFMAMSSYSKIRLKPELILYPDVLPGDDYYEDVNVATMLGLVNGFVNETDTPFHPQLPIKRIEALKIILGAAELVQPKYQFELIAELGSYKNLLDQKSPFNDVNGRVASMWWYPRYVNFAVENGIVDKEDYFRPNDDITALELNDIMNRTLQYLKEHDEKTKS